jgi:hypothetical protein
MWWFAPPTWRDLLAMIPLRGWLMLLAIVIGLGFLGFEIVKLF